MPKPMKGRGQTSDLRSALSHPDPQVVADFIQRIARSYGSTRDLGRTAEEFGTRRRTLERAIQDFPDLKAAIDRARNAAAIVP